MSDRFSCVGYSYMQKDANGAWVCADHFDTAIAALKEIAKPHFNELEYGPSFETMTARAALDKLGETI